MMRLFLVSLWATLASASDYNRVYVATMTELGDSNAFGRVTVFAASSDKVAYVGTASGVAVSLGASNCTGANGKCWPLLLSKRENVLLTTRPMQNSLCWHDDDAQPVERIFMLGQAVSPRQRRVDLCLWRPSRATLGRVKNTRQTLVETVPTKES